ARMQDLVALAGARFDGAQMLAQQPVLRAGHGTANAHEVGRGDAELAGDFLVSQQVAVRLTVGQLGDERSGGPAVAVDGGKRRPARRDGHRYLSFASLTLKRPKPRRRASPMPMLPAARNARSKSAHDRPMSVTRWRVVVTSH